MDRRRVALALLLAAACTRPLSGRELGPAMLADLRVEPRFVREGVPIAVAFRLPGGPVGDVTVELAGRARACAAERAADGSFRCTLPAISRTEYPQGPAELVVRAKDQTGTTSELRGQITLDFDCPELRRLTVEPPIGAPGALAVLTIESKELLRSPPTVSRAGRIWETATGTGTIFRVEHRVTAEDPGTLSDIVVRAIDLAGNTSGDCGIDGHVPFAVDRGAPTVDATRIELVRDVPGRPAVLTIARGALADDVAVTELAVHDADAPPGAPPLFVLTPGADGSVAPTPIDPAPRDRIRVEASDAAGKRSPRLLVRERWRVSIGLGEAQRAAIRAAVRVTPPPPGSAAMENRTADFALAIRDQDTMSAVVTAEVGFKNVGRLPTEYANTVRLAAGYDPAGHAIVAFGGRVKDGPYKDQTLVLRWNEFTRSYDDQVIPRGGQTPAARAGTQIAFDRAGAGMMFGGFDRDDIFGDLWRVSRSGAGYRWERLAVANGPAARFAPIAYDPRLERWIVAFGTGPSSTSTRDLWLLDRAGTQALRWTRVRPLPPDLDRSERGDLALWDDPGIGGQSFGLGFASPFFHTEELWSWTDGAFTSGTLARGLVGRTGHGFAFDVARRQLAVFGDDTDMLAELDRGTWLIPSPPSPTSPNGRRIDLEPRFARGGVTMVYDADREATIVLGGARYVDMTSVPPDVEEMVTPPSWPMLQAEVDLGVPRPDGVRALHLELRGAGSGDADGTGPGTAEASGFLVKLWDHGASRWVDVASGDSTRLRAPVALSLDVTDRPARFVSPDGVVPITLVSRWPATEEVDARLEVDRVDGWLELAPEVPAGARVVSFAAAPSAIFAGKTSTLAWSVRDASAVEIWSGGMRVFASQEPRGSFRVSPPRTTIYELRALEGRDVGASATATVSVQGVASPPIILSFSSDRGARARGGALELTYEVERTANVRILRGSTPIHAARGGTGPESFTTLIPLGISGTSTTFRLEATSAAGRDVREIRVRFADSRVVNEGAPVARYMNAISVPGESDLYELEVTSPGYIEANVFSPSSPSCTDGVDLYLYLLDAELRPLGYDDDDGEGSCPAIDPFGDTFAAVRPGVYFLQVDEYGDDAAVPAYELDVRIISQGCGNGRREMGEGCDDGNTRSGDGCSATCSVEALGAYTAPGSGRVVYTNAIALRGEVDTYRVEVGAPVWISAETFTPSSGGCADDTELVLLAADMTTVLQEDDDDGAGSCSLIQQQLAPGTYFLQVHEYDDDETIAAYQLVLDTPVPPRLEVEPNGTAAAATPLGTLGRGARTGTVAGAIAPAGDEDWYSFTLGAAASVRISTWTGPRDRTSCTRDDIVELRDDQQSLILAVDDTGGSYCGTIDGFSADPEAMNLPAGLYYVKVLSYDPADPVDFYELEIETSR